jgi:hypothetical protein
MIAGTESGGEHQRLTEMENDEERKEKKDEKQKENH